MDPGDLLPVRAAVKSMVAKLATADICTGTGPGHSDKSLALLGTTCLLQTPLAPGWDTLVDVLAGWNHGAPEPTNESEEQAARLHSACVRKPA